MILLLIETIKENNKSIALIYCSTKKAQYWEFFISNSQHWNICDIFTCPGLVVCPNDKVRINEAFKISNWGNQLWQIHKQPCSTTRFNIEVLTNTYPHWLRTPTCSWATRIFWPILSMIEDVHVVQNKLTSSINESIDQNFLVT